MTGDKNTKTWELGQLENMSLGEIINDWNYLEGLTERQSNTIVKLEAMLVAKDKGIAELEKRITNLSNGYAALSKENAELDKALEEKSDTILSMQGELDDLRRELVPDRWDAWLHNWPN